MFSSTETIVFQTDTALEHYAVVDRDYEGRPARVLFSGQRRAAQSGIGLDDDPDLLFDYNQRILEIANGLYAKRILVIGGGVYTLPMALVTALPDAEVDVVELDAGLEQIATDYFGLRPNDRLHIHIGDGREFIANSSHRYDLIIIDAFSELSIPRQFLTVEFMQEIHDALGKTGVVAFNIIATYQGRNAGLIKSQVAGYEATFEAVTIYPAAHGLTAWLPQNLVLVAQKGEVKNIDPYVRYAPITTIEASPQDAVHDAANVSTS